MPKEKKRSRRALLIIDVEPKFVTAGTAAAIPKIVNLIRRGRYDLFVLAEYTDGVRKKRARTQSAWQRMYGALHESEKTVPEIGAALARKPVLRVTKTTRSLLGPDSTIPTALRRRGIGTVHLAGLETHDCVFATALDAFDHDFLTRVVERCCASKHLASHRAACMLLRRAKLLI